MSILTLARRLSICLILPILSSSCAYRFTNIALRSPLGIQTIAVEGIWDNSREVIPHELLWSAVQREIIRNGRVTLSNQDEADALMVVSITEAKVSPSGVPGLERTPKDPVSTDSDKKTPTDYRNLRQAGAWTITEAISFSVHVNVYDLKSRALLFNRAYSSGIEFKSVRPDAMTPTESAYLHNEEALQAKFKAASDSLARSIVNDFLM